MPPNVEFESFPDDADSKVVHEYVPSGISMLPKMTGRDTPATGVDKWLECRRADDKVPDNLWRVHDTLYDLTDFLPKHPGGPSWLVRLRGTDITEPFEASHLQIENVRAILKKYKVREADTPRYSPITFKEDGFYATLRRRCAPIIKAAGKAPLKQSQRIADSFLAAFIVLMTATAYFNSFALAVVAGVVAALLSVTSHNYGHQGDNFRMYYMDLTVLNNADFRMSHATSHHLYPNTNWDLELWGLEATWPLLPMTPVNEGKHTTSFLKTQLLWFIGLPISWVVRMKGMFWDGKEVVRPERFLMLIELWYMFKVSNSYLYPIPLFALMHCCSAWTLLSVGMYASHHVSTDHGTSWHAADDNMPTDFGLLQVETTSDRIEVLGNPTLNLVSFGDHTLHHLFPTLDHAYLPLLYSPLVKTCKEFGVEFTFTTYMDHINGWFKQLTRKEPQKDLVRVGRAVQKTKKEE
ncbi:hypothetical protein SmJEL517_g04504 [Synchytrium microbalum]|uniref:Cytochrome b5 heme-binding domain-containing protein n=1 Tax=Synchytrium microbalum TaxID=1806994 RepID=A0A507C428_9FUNG|nr:uncharacterized protein SmJEL517_g04504 [Synchytrium microbalum]TPX32325.1 hypothetical protein SmJEL517_g04504 [Synchytrium microbalum]